MIKLTGLISVASDKNIQIILRHLLVTVYKDDDNFACVDKGIDSFVTFH